jgi:Tfp pilus assembly protein PilF/peroxiredoxin
VNLWASWCTPCIRKLGDWQTHADQFQQAGVDVLAINVDEPRPDRQTQREQIDRLVETLQLPFVSGYGSLDLVNQFDVLQRAILRRQQPLPVPCSFLIDGRGNLRVIYKGPVEAHQVIADSRWLDASPEEVVAASLPYPGIWLGVPAGSSPNQIAVKFVEGGFVKEAERYIRQLSRSEVENPMYNAAEAHVLLGALCLDQRRYEESAEAFRKVLEIDPHHRQSHIELAGVLMRLGQPGEAARHYQQALERRTNDPELRLKLGLALLRQGRADAALEQFQSSARLRPTAVAYHHAGNALIQLGRLAEAVNHFEQALVEDPQFAASANNLAWLLATREMLRDGQRAVALAESLCQSPAGRTAGNLDTLAAAYAAASRFSAAVQTAEEASRLANLAGDRDKARRIEARLELYRQGRPFRE